MSQGAALAKHVSNSILLAAVALRLRAVRGESVDADADADAAPEEDRASEKEDGGEEEEDAVVSSVLHEEAGGGMEITERESHVQERGAAVYSFILGDKGGRGGGKSFRVGEPFSPKQELCRRDVHRSRPPPSPSVLTLCLRTGAPAHTHTGSPPPFLLLL